MASESTAKDLFRTFFHSMFRVVGFGAGLIILLVIISIILKKPPTPQHVTSAAIVPNHEWAQQSLSASAPTIVKVNIRGVIGTDHLTTDQIKNQLIDTINGEIHQEQVKGVLLSIDTPGGAADDSDNIYTLLLSYKQRFNVPIYAYVNGMCASGGMLIACAADKVYASNASLVGHVGVIMPPIFNFSSLMERVGIQAKTIVAGKDKDAMNPFRPWKPDEAAPYQAITDSYYQRFIGIVSKSRPKLTKESLLNQGAIIYTANEAEELGYIDGRSDMIEDVMKTLATDLGIEKEYQVVELQTKNWLDSLFEGEQVLFPKRVIHEVRLPGMPPDALQGKFLYLYSPQLDHEHGKTLSH